MKWQVWSYTCYRSFPTPVEHTELISGCLLSQIKDASSWGKKNDLPSNSSADLTHLSLYRISFFNGVYCFNTITSTFSKDNYRALIYTPETHCLDFYILFTWNSSVTKQLFVSSKYFFSQKLYLEILKCLFICTRQRPFLLTVTSEEQVEVIHWQDMDYLANLMPLHGQALFGVFLPFLVGLNIIFLPDCSCK